MRLHETVRKLRAAGVRAAKFDSKGNLLEVEFISEAEERAVHAEAAIQQSIAKIDEEWDNLSEEEKKNLRLYGHST